MGNRRLLMAAVAFLTLFPGVLAIGLIASVAIAMLVRDGDPIRASRSLTSHQRQRYQRGLLPAGTRVLNDWGPMLFPKIGRQAPEARGGPAERGRHAA